MKPEQVVQRIETLEKNIEECKTNYKLGLNFTAEQKYYTAVEILRELREAGYIKLIHKYDSQVFDELVPLYKKAQGGGS